MSNIAAVCELVTPMIVIVDALQLRHRSGRSNGRVVGVEVCIDHEARVEHQASVIHGWRPMGVESSGRKGNSVKDIVGHRRAILEILYSGIQTRFCCTLIYSRLICDMIV